MSDRDVHDLDLECALLDPASSFNAPQDVERSPELSRVQKIEILSRWAYEARELAVAEEEGMGGGGTRNNLDAVAAALNSLVGTVDGEHGAPCACTSGKTDLQSGVSSGSICGHRIPR